MSHGFDSGGYGDGGFVGGSQSGDQSGYGRGGGAQRPREPSTFLPVTGRQVAMADMRDAKCRIDGQDAPQVSMVGQLHSVDPASTYVSFVLDDGTGDVKVKMTIRENTSRKDGLEHVQQFAYVKIYGRLNENNGSRALIALGVKKITDFNELTFHALDALRCHLGATQGPVPVANQSNPYAPVKQSPYSASPYGAAPASAQQPGQYRGGMSERDQVLAAFSAAIGEIGASVHAISEQCKLPLMRIREIVSELSAEGMIYGTTDDDHYKSVDQ